MAFDPTNSVAVTQAVSRIDERLRELIAAIDEMDPREFRKIRQMRRRKLALERTRVKLLQLPLFANTHPGPVCSTSEKI